MPRENLRDLIVGAAAAVATPFDENYEVDLGKMYDLTQWWVANGLTKGNGIIKVAAAAGEGPMLDDPEWAALLRTTVQASDGKATVMCGLHYKDTKRTIRDAKVAQDMGAYALQVCPPIFNDPSQDDLLDYFGDLSDAIDIGIMVYHTHWLKGGRIETDTLLRMADFENVVAIKWSPHDGQVYEDMAKFVDRFNIIDNTVNPSAAPSMAVTASSRRAWRPIRRTTSRSGSSSRPNNGTRPRRCTAVCKGRCGSSARRSASVQAVREG